MFGVAAALACSHEPRATPAANAVPPVPAAPSYVEGVVSERPVRGSAPSSDPATDQTILARGAPASGGSQSFELGNGLGGSSAGTAGVGMGGAAGAKPVMRRY